MTNGSAVQNRSGEHLILERIQTGADTLVVGEPEHVRRALAAAAAALADHARVLLAAAPAGGLSLSGLMAQLSGHEDLGGHDDSVLEHVFRLLSGSDAPGNRSVLVLDACEGLQRSVLQYVAQAGRILPGLAFVIGAERVPDALTDAPGLSGLRARLLQYEPVPACAGDPVPASPEPVPEPALMPAPARPVPLARAAAPARPRWPVAAPLARRRWRAASSAAIGTGMAASLALGVLVGHATMPRAKREPWPELTGAVVPAAPLAAVLLPAPSAQSHPTLAASPAPAPAPASRLALAAPARPQPAPGAPPSVATAAAAPVVPPPPNRPASVVIGLMQEGAPEGGWSGPARVLNERSPVRRPRPYPARSRFLPPAPPAGIEAAQPAERPSLSRDQVEDVRNHFGRPERWDEPPPPVPYPSDDGDW